MPVKQDIILRLERQFVYFTSTFGEEYTVASYCHILRITPMHRIIAIHINVKAHRTTRAKCILSDWKQKWCVHWINSYFILNLKNKIQIDSWSKGEKDHQFSWSCSYVRLCDPMNCSMPGLLVHHQIPEFTQTHVHWVSDAIQPSHPLSSPSPPALNLSRHQGLFRWVSFSHQVAKVLQFQPQHQPFQWTPRTDLL